MAVYVKAIKETETSEVVTYLYGDNPDSFNGIIEISVADLSWKITKISSTKGGKFLALAIIPKIIIRYKEDGVFPAVISKES